MEYFSTSNIRVTDWDDIESPTERIPTDQTLTPLPSSRSEFLRAQEEEISHALATYKQENSLRARWNWEMPFPRHQVGMIKNIGLTPEAEEAKRWRDKVGSFDSAMKKMYSSDMTGLTADTFPMWKAVTHSGRRTGKSLTMANMYDAYNRIMHHGVKPNTVYMNPTVFRDFKGSMGMMSGEYRDLLTEMISLAMSQGMCYEDAAKESETRLEELLKEKSW